MQITVKNLDGWLDGHPRYQPCTTLVLHATAGHGVGGAVATLREKGFSYHYIVPFDGSPVLKCLPARMVAYHAGSSWGPREQMRGVSRAQDQYGTFRAGCSVNSYSIGVSFENLDDGKDPYSDYQHMAAEYLATALKPEFPELHFVTTHAIVSPHRKTDPLGFDLDEFAAAAGLKAWRP